jgi:hypothetical protein
LTTDFRMLLKPKSETNAALAQVEKERYIVRYFRG